MNSKPITAFVLLTFCASLTAPAPVFARGYSGGGGRPAPSSASRPSGGFNMSRDTAPAKPPPGNYSHSSTGPGGTNRTTNATVGNNGAARTTTATNGNYSKTTTAAGTSNGNYARQTTASNGSGAYASRTTGNTNTGNYNRTTAGVNSSGYYYGNTYKAGGSVTYTGVRVYNPIYRGYPAYGWNRGVIWYPAYGYYGGGFWGPYAAGVASALVMGTIIINNQPQTSYQVEANSPGATLLKSYQLTQVPCGPPNLVVIFGPTGGVICANPNNLVSAGNYEVDSTNLTLVSQK